MAKQKRLGEMLLEAGLITRAQLEGALERQRKWGGRFGRNLVLNGAIKDEDLMRFFAARTGVKEMDISGVQILPHIIKKVPRKIAEKYHLVPLAMKDKHTLIVACADPTDLGAIDQVSFVTGHKIEPVISSYQSIMAAINRFYLGGKSKPQEPTEEAVAIDDGPRMVQMESMEKHGGHQALEDPDLIIFGDQTESDIPSGGGVAPFEASEPDPVPVYSPGLEPAVEDTDEFTLDFDSLSNDSLPDLERQAEPRQAEPRQAGPGQAGPHQAGPHQAGPRQAEPRQAEPRQAAPRQAGPNEVKAPAGPTTEKKLLALYRLLIRKGIITDQEFKLELKRFYPK